MMPVPSAQAQAAKQHHTIKRPSVKALLAAAKVTSHTRELDISFAYDVTPAVLKTLCMCMPHLRKLIVREVGLTELPNEVGRLRDLRELDVSHNALQALPSSMGNLHELQHLNLSRNKVAQLPDTISSMTSLRLLNANYNALSALPKSFGDLTALRVLRLGANALSALPPELGCLFDLRLVQLAYNSISAVPTVLWDLPELKVVDISYNQIMHWPHDQPLPLTLSSLNVSGNGFLLAQVPAALVAAQSHEFKIIGLSKSGTRAPRSISTLKTQHPGSEDDRLSLNVTQDLTGILFAGLKEHAADAEPASDVELGSSSGPSRPDPQGPKPRE